MCCLVKLLLVSKELFTGYMCTECVCVCVDVLYMTSCKRFSNAWHDTQTHGFSMLYTLRC